MLGFTPFKRHANKFNYIPRYYDPEKEAREQRRAELRGERAEDGIVSTVPDNISVRSAMPVPPAVPRRMTRGVCASGRWPVPQLSSCCSSTSFIRSSPMCSCVPVRRRHRPESAATESAPRNGLDQTGISDVEWQEQPITVVPNDYQE